MSQRIQCQQNGIASFTTCCRIFAKSAATKTGPDGQASTSPGTPQLCGNGTDDFVRNRCWLCGLILMGVMWLTFLDSGMRAIR